MKKVLAIAPYIYLPYFSGGQKFIAQFLEYLAKEIDLTVASLGENDFSLVKGYKTIPLLKKNSFSRYSDLSLISGIIKLIKKEKFDTIIWEHPYYAWLAWIIKKRTGIKTVIHSHNIEYKRFRSMGKWWWWMLKIYERWFFRFSDRIFFITPEDKNFAVTKWKIKNEKCSEVYFGIELKEFPVDRTECKKIILSKHNISDDEKILFFNGLLDYKPNLEALDVILNQINPLLLNHTNFKYKIIICGKRLPADRNELKDYADKNIIYAGFVQDIETYFKAADLFLNPVQFGGGIKTKMVEAVGFGTSVTATKTGAIGIDQSVCRNKLIVVPDNDWQKFSSEIINNANKNEITPTLYYEKYYWGNIVKGVISYE
jgi:glycosyltransferase involved in cell wall biosynthesis